MFFQIVAGSGKSTLIRLLLRLFEAEGDIEIDRQKIRNVTQNSLRKEIGLVPQDITLFNESINILFNSTPLKNQA